MKSEKSSFKIFWGNNKVWLRPLLIFLPIGVIWALWQKRKFIGGDTLKEKLLGRSDLQSGGFACKSNSYPLQIGTCHKDVEILQGYLKSRKQNLGTSGKNRDGVDGQFGALTRDAAKKVLGKESFTSQDIAKLKKMK